MDPVMTEQATIGGGCFWCIEAVYKEIDGVESVTSGYAGGRTDDPTYEEVCSGRTGHAEVVQVAYDPETIDYRTILEIFLSIHDPTQKDRQGPDVGTQYRSIVLTHDDDQAEVAEQVIAELEGDVWEGIQTDVEPLERFWPAEEYHQDYYEKNPENPYCQAQIDPKLAKLRKSWSDRLTA